MNGTASVEGDARLRLFCALRLPADAVGRLVEWQAALPAGPYRAVPPGNLHVTLAFLGARPAGEVEAIVTELEHAARSAGPIVLRASGYRETRSVGMVAFDDEGGAAAALAADLHERLRRLGVYEPERRRWLPHVTVVRFRERPGLEAAAPGLGAVSPSDASVYHSVLRPNGAQYFVLHSFPLRDVGG